MPKRNRRRLPPSIEHLWSVRFPYGEGARAAQRERAAQLDLFDEGGPSLLKTLRKSLGLGRRVRRELHASIVLPETFSFIDDPEGAVRCLVEFVDAATSGARSLMIDQQACRQIDLCAGSVLNALALEFVRRPGVRISGRFPKNAEALEIVVATGLPRVLQVGGLPELTQFRTFRMRSGPRRKRSPLQASTKETVGSELTAYLSSCFLQCGHELRDEGRRRIGKLLGEALANAEDHSEGGPWFISGYLRQPRSKSFGDCHLAIFNFGPSVADTLRTIPPGVDREDIEDLVRRHRGGGFFRFRGWSEDALWTLYALQEGVSRLNRPDTSRGFGTADMIEEFESLGRTSGNGPEPRMCLVSGQTHVKWDGRFSLRLAEMEGGQQRRVIAFNADNDLGKPPSTDAVGTLAVGFPGTLVSLRFYIDPIYLRAKGGVS